MAKASFLLGAIVGGAAAVAATLKLTGVEPEELKDAVANKISEFKEQSDFDPEDLKYRAGSSVEELRQRGIDLANRANQKFNGDIAEEENIVVDNSKQYDQPTEVFMPHKEK